MPTRNIILKTAPKRKGTVSRSRIRKAVKSVFGTVPFSAKRKTAAKKAKAFAGGDK